MTKEPNLQPRPGRRNPLKIGSTYTEVDDDALNNRYESNQVAVV